MYWGQIGSCLSTVKSDHKENLQEKTHAYRILLHPSPAEPGYALPLQTV